MIAISYRRDDSLAITGRLYDRLRAEFGRDNVFMDLDSIGAGADFRDQIRQTIGRADVLIAVIGPKWIGPRVDSSCRINEDGDIVRLEIASALMQKVPIIPVLVNNTTMPQPASLPPDIQELAFRNALPLDSGMDFHLHVDRLITSIRRLVSRPQQTATGERRRPPGLLIIGATVVGAIIVGLATWLMNAKQSRESKPATLSTPVRQTALTDTSPTVTASPASPSIAPSAKAMSKPLNMALTAPPARSTRWSEPISIPVGMQCYWESERDQRGERKPLYVLVNGTRIIYWDGRQASLGANVTTLEFRSAGDENTIVSYRLVPLAK